MPNKIVFPDTVFDALSYAYLDEQQKFDQLMTAHAGETLSTQHQGLMAYWAECEGIRAEPEFVLALALKAAGHGQVTLMQNLVQELLQFPTPHPRAYLLQAYGLSAEGGAKKKIKEQLALCLRGVRKNADFKAEGQIATAILLSLHFD